MPIFDYHCTDCKAEWESIEIWESYKVTNCPKCHSTNIEKIIGTPHIRTNSDAIKHELPDPVPPLRELIGKQREGCEGGYKELENDQRELKEYKRIKDKWGNSVWLPKERKYFYGKGESKSKKEME